MVGLSAGSTSIVQVYGGLTDLDAGSHDLPVHRWSALLWMAKVRKVNIYHELNADGQVYHVDKGEGCDFYGVGAARGVGGTGIRCSLCSAICSSRNCTGLKGCSSSG